jgi:signal transduction histidine kinase
LDKSIAQSISPSLPKLEEDRPGLVALPNKHYFGAVFLTQANAPSLRMLVNREGFVPDAVYENLVRTVRNGIDLATRVRAVATAQQRFSRRSKRASASDGVVSTDFSFVLRSLAGAQQHAQSARQFAQTGRSEAAVKELNAALVKIKEVTEASDAAADERSMLRVLASVGTQLSAFVHELNGTLGMATATERALSAIIDSQDESSRSTRARLKELLRAMGDLRRHIERHASYLVDVVSVDARRRRSRQSLKNRFDAAARLIETAASKRGIEIVNKISEEAKSPAMFPAELTTIFANLLTNAIKAAGSAGKVRAVSKQYGERVVVRVENTGKAVKLSSSERWFKPFESSSAEVDPILGQGMGLGLTITRAMLESYGARIVFIKPSPGYVTALEITFNG